MAVAVNVEDLRIAARRRLPRMLYDFVDGGSWSEATSRANESDFAALRLRQRVGVDIAERTLRTKLAGQPAEMPLALAPTGLAGMLWPDGEIAAARAARQLGIPFTLSTMSTVSIEDVAAHTNRHPFWFQLYMMRDRGFVEQLMQRAQAAGCTALVLTLDLQVFGQRHRDLRNGLSMPPRASLRTALDLLGHPRWIAGFLKSRRRGFGNIVGHAPGAENMGSIAEWSNRQLDPGFNWNDLAWVRRRWSGKLILKGVMDAGDARRALDTGADALIVSNHGGRQLDGAPSTVRVLPEIVEAVGSRIEVHMDGGVRTGQDVLKALALGAKAAHIGRAWLYGLASRGEAGVAEALGFIARELDLSMAFCGCRNVPAIGKHVLHTGDNAAFAREGLM